MKFLIAGRTGTGKDRLAALLANTYGWKIAKSSTTRPRYYPEENTHFFITEETAAATPETEKYLKTVLNGYEYFTTKTEIEQSDAFIIEPDGIRELIQTRPDLDFEIISIRASNDELRKEMVIKRAEDPEKAAAIFESRSASENDRFAQFEKEVDDLSIASKHCNVCITMTNDYEEETMNDIAFQLNSRRQSYQNLVSILKDLITCGALAIDNANNICVYKKGNDPDIPIKEYMNFDQFSQLLLYDKEGMGAVMTQWLALPGNTVAPILSDTK